MGLASLSEEAALSGEYSLNRRFAGAFPFALLCPFLDAIGNHRDEKQTLIFCARTIQPYGIPLMR